MTGPTAPPSPVILRVERQRHCPGRSSRRDPRRATSVADSAHIDAGKWKCDQRHTDTVDARTDDCAANPTAQPKGTDSTSWKLNCASTESGMGRWMCGSGAGPPVSYRRHVDERFCLRSRPADRDVGNVRAGRESRALTCGPPRGPPHRDPVRLQGVVVSLGRLPLHSGIACHAMSTFGLWRIRRDRRSVE